MIVARQEFGRLLLTPPGVPAERLAAFRRAFDAYPSGEGRLALSGEDLDRYRKSGSMAVSTC